MGIGIDDMAPVYFAGNLVTRVNSFCVLGSMINSEDDPLLTLQHRAALAWRQCWNLKDELRARDTAMKSRLALLHLAVIPVLLWAAGTWTPSVKLYRAIRCVYGTLVQRMEGRRAKARGTMAQVALENIQVSPSACRGNGVSESRQNGASEAMELRRSRCSHLDITSDATLAFWKCAISLGGETIKDDGVATNTSIDDRVPKGAGNNTFDDYRNTF